MKRGSSMPFFICSSPKIAIKYYLFYYSQFLSVFQQQAMKLFERLEPNNWWQEGNIYCNSKSINRTYKKWVGRPAFRTSPHLGNGLVAPPRRFNTYLIKLM